MATFGDHKQPEPFLTEEEAFLRARRRGRRRIALGAIFATAFVAAAGWYLLEGGAERTEPQLRRALAHWEAGDTKAALIELKGVVHRAPDDPEARWQLGRLHLERKDGLAAIKELERAMALGEGSPELTLDLLEAMLLRGRYAQVLERFADLDDESARSPRGFLVRGRAQLGAGELDEARTAFEAALAADETALDARLGLVSVALGSGELEEGEREARQLLESHPKHPTAWELLGEILLQGRRYEEAIDALSQAFATGAPERSVRLKLAQTFVALGDPEQAQPHLDALYSVAPRSAEVNYLRGLAAQQKGDPSAASDALFEALRSAPKDPRILTRLASIEYELGRLASAQELALPVLFTQPDNLVARKVLGAAQLDRGEGRSAVETLSPLLADSPDDAGFHRLMGKAFLAAGEPERGLHHLRRAIALGPDNHQAHLELASILFRAGDTTGALETFDAAAAFEHDTRDAETILVLLYLEAGQHDQAIARANDLVRRDPGSSHAHNLAGAAYAAKGESTAARRAYEAAIAAKPEGLAPRLNLARLWVAMGRLADAEAEYRAVLERVPDQPQALAALAELVERAGRSEEALELLGRARRENPRALAPRIALVNHYLRAGAAHDALIVAREAHELAPASKPVLLGLAQAQLLAGEIAAALETAGAAAGRYPGSSDVALVHGVAAVRAGDAGLARTAFERALDLAPDHLQAAARLATLALREGEPQEALALARRIQAAHPGSPRGYDLEGDAHLALGDARAALSAYDRTASAAGATGEGLLVKRARALTALGDRAQALRMLDDWLSSHPEAVRARLASAHLLAQGGRTEEARVRYEQVLVAAPDTAVAHNNLALLYLDAGEPGALEHAERAHRLAPDHASYMDTYGWVLLKSGSPEQANRMLERAVDAAPDNPTFRLHLAKGLKRSGRAPEARLHLEHIVSLPGISPEKAEAEELIRAWR